MVGGPQGEIDTFDFRPANFLHPGFNVLDNLQWNSRKFGELFQGQIAAFSQVPNVNGYDRLLRAEAF